MMVTRLSTPFLFEKITLKFQRRTGEGVQIAFLGLVWVEEGRSSHRWPLAPISTKAGQA